MAKGSEGSECDVIEGIIEELDETVRTLDKIKKKMEWFHAKTFRQT